MENHRDIALIEELASQIWRRHYVGIISQEQIDYMLDRFQSIAAIKSQINDGYQYSLVKQGQQAIGYISTRTREQELFISKIYIRHASHGKGAGFAAFQHIEKKAQTLGLSNITLTVNRANSIALDAYHRWGMTMTGELVTDIGNGYIMDDYCFSKTV